MRRAGAVIIAAVLALAGCKGTDSKDDKAPGGFMGRPKDKTAKNKDKDDLSAKGPSWLDDVAKLPGAGTSVPKGNGGPSDPRDPGFDPKAAAQDALGGRVLDPNGKPARNVYIRLEQVGVSPGGPAPIGIYTNNEGYFFTRGLKAGKTYDLTAEATQEGKTLTGVVQTKVPNPILLIVLRDDLPLPGGGLPTPKGPDGGVFPPNPRPSDKIGDGSWNPSGPATGVPPASIGGTAPKPGGMGGSGGTGAVPPPDDLTPPEGMKPSKPENVAEGKKDFKPPATNIPGPGGPAVPPLPTLPPPLPPPGGRSSMNTSAPGKLTLMDTLERPWDLDSVRPGGLVLVEFMTTTCEYCPKVIPILKDMQSRYGASGLQVAGVLCDNIPQKDRIATATKYSRDYNLNYALYVEPGDAGSVRDRFAVDEYPHAILLNATGKVLWRGHPGDRAKLESVIKQNLVK